MPVAENSVLVPKSSELKNPDDWEIFALTEANVFSQKTGQPCSLLSANTDNPVKVTGRLLEVDEELSHLILDPKYINRTIQIPNVTSFSYAEFEDGTYGFWAPGQAGWFELRETVPGYKSILEDMNVATSMLYFIADKFRRSRKTDLNTREFQKYILRFFQDVCWSNFHRK